MNLDFVKIIKLSFLSNQQMLIDYADDPNISEENDESKHSVNLNLDAFMKRRKKKLISKGRTISSKSAVTIFSSQEAVDCICNFC